MASPLLAWVLQTTQPQFGTGSDWASLEAMAFNDTSSERRAKHNRAFRLHLGWGEATHSISGSRKADRAAQQKSSLLPQLQPRAAWLSRDWKAKLPAQSRAAAAAGSPPRPGSHAPGRPRADGPASFTPGFAQPVRAEERKLQMGFPSLLQTLKRFFACKYTAMCVRAVCVQVHCNVL